MSDETVEPTKPETVRVVLDLPSGLVGFYDLLVDARIYRDRQDAMSHALVESHRFVRGSYHNLRIDVDDARRSEGNSAAPETSVSIGVGKWL